jgi:ferritin-like metal-binding protein YciE
MAISNLQELFVHGLAEMQDAEERFIEAQKKMLSKASNDTLQSMLKEHIGQTSEQLEQIKNLASSLETSLPQATNSVAKSLVEEGEKMIEQAGDNSALRDVVIAEAISKVEHFEIGSYQPLIAAAEQMGHRTAAQKLNGILQQEEMTAQKVVKNAPSLLKQAQSSKEASA